MNARKLTNIINSYSMMIPEAAKKTKFVFIRYLDIKDFDKGFMPCEVWTLENLRKMRCPFHNADKPIWFEKSINRELSVIYEDLSILEDEKPKE